VPSNLNFYAIPYNSHNFQLPQKTTFYKLYNFFKLALFLLASSAISLLVGPSLMLSLFSYWHQKLGICSPLRILATQQGSKERSSLQKIKR